MVGFLRHMQGWKKKLVEKKKVGQQKEIDRLREEKAAKEVVHVACD